MDYIKCTFTFQEPKPWSEILMTYLTALPFESFNEEGNSLDAYIPEPSYKKDEVEAIINDLPYSEVTFTEETIKDKNWNAEWEKNFDPIFIDDLCVVKAPFHNIEQVFPYEILINPQMSFGTGHHQTTYLILKELFQLNVASQSILDMGCGTGILAILTEKLKAKNILAIDIDQWSFQNTLDNIKLNSCKNIVTQKGGAELLNKSQSFNVILANINRNILLQDMKSYVEVLAPKGEILMSGFYITDVSVVEEKANSLGLKKVSVQEKEGWAMVKFVN